MKIQDVFDGGDFQERTTNYIQLAKNIADDYGYDHSQLSQRLSHGVQKDAIQNAWDAKFHKTHKFLKDNWKCEFELAEVAHGERILSIIDFGTSGLTGSMTTEDLKSEAISADELPKDEKWARWESFGFTKGEGLGARGQGKMIFMLASADHTIYYDSLREDGTYRFGGSTATETGCPLVHLDGQEGKQAIKSKLGLEPLSHIGTRVIIMNPVDEVVQDIQNGNLLSFVEETWWPNILKYEVGITVKHDGKVAKAGVPEIFPIRDDTPETKNFKTWVRNADDFKKKKVGFKVKRLCAACNKDVVVDELHQGLACFRDGMKVDVIRFADKNLRDKVYGYVEFDEELETELRAIEKPTHYAFKGTLWTKLRHLVEQELDAFGNKKLGLAIDSQALTNMRRSRAESRALAILRGITKDWPISKWSKGGGGGGNGGNGSHKTIGVRLSNLTFPNPGDVPRLDYGQKLEGFDIVVFNREANARDLSLDAFVLSGDSKILDITKESFQLESKSDKVFSKHSLEIRKEDFISPGEYRLRLNLIDNINNNRIDQITRRFWVEMDPKLTGPFDVKRLDFADLPSSHNIDRRLEWILYDEGDGKYALYYNTGHAAYTHNDETEQKLVPYLSELFLMGALEMFIRQSSAKMDESMEDKAKPLDLEILKSPEPLDTYRECTYALSKLREDIYRLV